MSVKASVSISEQQEAFARDLVAQGRYASLSAVVQRGIELLREEASARRRNSRRCARFSTPGRRGSS